jgi:formate dehydrogenase subunit gamma
MTTQTRVRAIGGVTLGVLLLFLLSGIFYWQAVGADISNPHANFWRAVREGVPGFTTVSDAAHRTLIRNGGENWRELRNGLIVRFSPWVFAVVLVIMGLLYLIVGREKLEKPPSGVMIKRYGFGERLLHWYTAVMFIIMGLTGLSLLWGRAALIPIFGHPFVSGYLGATKLLHNYLGPLLLAGIFLEFVVWVRDGIPHKYDLAWFKNMGGMLGGERPHIGMINGGEKAWFWLVFLFGIGVGVTGTLLDFQIWGQTRFTMQASHVIHATVAVLFVAASLGHIYMGTVGVEGAFGAMWTGYVDAVWAEQNHDLWYEEKMREKGANRETKVPKM